MAKTENIFGELGGGGRPLQTGTFYTTSANQSVSVDTGISDLKGFIVWGLSASGYNQQIIVRWEESLGNYYYSGAAYATGGTYVNKPFSSSANQYAPTIVSISSGTVSLKNMTQTTNWGSSRINYIWYAW